MRAARLVAAVVAAGLTAIVVAIGSAHGSANDSKIDGARCTGGTVDAVIATKRVCSRKRQRCSKRLDGQYHSYWLHCHSGRLASTPPAGKVVATIPVPAVGGIAVGGGAVWVANMNPRTVTRIDPESNAVVATISLGEPDFQWGLTRVAFGHGSLWVVDGLSSSVLRIDPQLNRVSVPIPLGSPTQFSSGPLGIAVTPDAVWVANTWGTTESPNGSVVRIDPRLNAIVERVALGASPSDFGPRAVAATGEAVWVGILSTKSVVRVDPATGSVVTEVKKLACAEGGSAADTSGVWVADCTSIRRIDTRTNAIARTIPMPRATGQGVLGVAVGLGSVWAQAGPLVRIDPASGAVTGVLPLEAVWNDCAYSIAFGFGSIWVRQHDQVVRIQP
ncbi:MAG: YncE family protein [Thermoleophilia bacterium]|nr:YncE family protein [Thermoleophilia bacterium]MDH5281975.1 YncE family protein [Thermoleophilia bacterium]